MKQAVTNAKLRNCVQTSSCATTKLNLFRKGAIMKSRKGLAMCKALKAIPHVLQILIGGTKLNLLLDTKT